MIVALQPPRTRPADHWIAPSRCLRKFGLAVAGGGPAHAGVEGAPALEVAAPGDRPVACRPSRCRRRPGRRSRGSGRRCGPCRSDAGSSGTRCRCASTRAADLLVAGCTRSPTATTWSLTRSRAGGIGPGRTDQAGDERVAGLGLSRAADADEAAAGLDVGLERGLLGGAEPVALVVEEDHGAVVREVRGVELRRVGGVVDREAVRGPERLDRGDTRVRSSRPSARGTRAREAIARARRSRRPASVRAPRAARPTDPRRRGGLHAAAVDPPRDAGHIPASIELRPPPERPTGLWSSAAPNHT